MDQNKKELIQWVQRSMFGVPYLMGVITAIVGFVGCIEQPQQQPLSSIGCGIVALALFKAAEFAKP